MPGRHVSLVWQHDPTLYAPAKYRRACKYEAFIPEFLIGLPLSLSAEVAGVVSEAESRILALNQAALPALAPLARLLLRIESVASSKVEGMQIGVRELARAEARRETGRKVGSRARDIMANIDAMELAVAGVSTPERFTADDILAIHRRLMETSSNAHIAGLVRTTQNWIGGNDYNPCGADFVPPPPDHIGVLLADLCEAVNRNALPPVVQAGLVHAQFEAIHPFEDGNGRTGRTLIHVVLRRRGLASAYVPPISVILAAARDRYISGLVRFQGDGASEWIEHFAGAAAEAAHLATEYLDAVRRLCTQWRVRLSAEGAAPRADAAAWAVIDVLPAHPTLTGPVAIAATGRSKPSIYKALGQLEAAGVLVPLTRSQRNRAWEAVGFLDLLADLEAGRPPR